MCGAITTCTLNGLGPLGAEAVFSGPSEPAFITPTGLGSTASVILWPMHFPRNERNARERERGEGD